MNLTLSWYEHNQGSAPIRASTAPFMHLRLFALSVYHEPSHPSCSYPPAALSSLWAYRTLHRPQPRSPRPPRPRSQFRLRQHRGHPRRRPPSITPTGTPTAAPVVCPAADVAMADARGPHHHRVLFLETHGPPSHCLSASHRALQAHGIDVIQLVRAARTLPRDRRSRMVRVQDRARRAANRARAGAAAGGGGRGRCSGAGSGDGAVRAARAGRKHELPRGSGRGGSGRHGGDFELDKGLAGGVAVCGE